MIEKVLYFKIRKNTPEWYKIKQMYDYDDKYIFLNFLYELDADSYYKELALYNWLSQFVLSVTIADYQEEFWFSVNYLEQISELEFLQMQLESLKFKKTSKK